MRCIISATSPDFNELQWDAQAQFSYYMWLVQSATLMGHYKWQSIMPITAIELLKQHPSKAQLLVGFTIYSNFAIAVTIWTWHKVLGFILGQSPCAWDKPLQEEPDTNNNNHKRSTNHPLITHIHAWKGKHRFIFRNKILVTFNTFSFSVS